MPENLDLPCSTNCRVAEPLIERIMCIPFRPRRCAPEVKKWFTSAEKNSMFDVVCKAYKLIQSRWPAAWVGNTDHPSPWKLKQLQRQKTPNNPDRYGARHQGQSLLDKIAHRVAEKMQ